MLVRLLASIVLLTGVPIAVAAPSLVLTGTVVRVADGDTVTITVGQRTHKVRIDGIDAPERSQAFGEQARVSLADMTEGQTVQAFCSKIDRFGRDVCKVKRGDTDVGLEQIRRGLAWHFKRYADEQSSSDRAAYASAEDDARRGQRGLWAEPTPQAPWDWRAEHARAAR